MPRGSRRACGSLRTFAHLSAPPTRPSIVRSPRDRSGSARCESRSRRGRGRSPTRPRRRTGPRPSGPGTPPGSSGTRHCSRGHRRRGHATGSAREPRGSPRTSTAPSRAPVPPDVGLDHGLDCPIDRSPNVRKARTGGSGPSARREGLHVFFDLRRRGVRVEGDEVVAVV